MRIAYITAGAAGMFCGSCLHDNTLVTELIAQGHDALLIPTYTPIRTDERDVSQKRVFFGGINVFLQQKSAVFRHTPWSLDRLLDGRRLLNWVSRFAARTDAKDLGDITISMLKGEHGHQRKEIAKLVRWLKSDVRPELINLTNVLLSGMVPELKKHCRAPVLGTLQGDDIFLESLAEPYRGQALALIREHCRELDGFIATSAYYADFMARYLEIPRERIDVVYPGLNLVGHGENSGRLRSRLANQVGSDLANDHDSCFHIGYFARICPEKGLHLLAEAFRLLHQAPGTPPCRLHISGWLGESQRGYLDDIQKRLGSAGLSDRIVHVEAPSHADKVRFFQSLDVLSVPTTYREPKGLYVLEAWANGVPVVQPRHGSFPELVERTGGGMLVNPDDPEDLARGLRRMMDDPVSGHEMGRSGRETVEREFHAAKMAENTLRVYRKYL